MDGSDGSTVVMDDSTSIGGRMASLTGGNKTVVRVIRRVGGQGGGATSIIGMNGGSPMGTASGVMASHHPALVSYISNDLYQL